MISEIYASGRNGVSAFLIVENGIIVHRGSHKWTNTISFEGFSAYVNDIDCEILAVICAVLMCRNNNRMMINIYTDDDACQPRYLRLTTASAFLPSLKRCLEGLEVYAESFRDLTFGEEFKKACLEMTR